MDTRPLGSLTAKVRARSRRQWGWRDDSGQALAELPVVVILVCIVIMMLLQPVATLYTKMALGQVAASVARVVATETADVSGSREIALSAYAQEKLEGLPAGAAFRVPGTTRVHIQGNARSELIEVVVSVRQQPLPLMGLLVGAGMQGDLEVRGRARTKGAQVGVVGSPRGAPQSFGYVKP
ncbi:MAG: hypothetical protein FWE46_00485 [Coriobacteriia bacterium]|nr:hypothetical protein [Coriobacteriia bacterium]MCL2536749.1 hypothetical protein [Coriobacteriia bacterium]